MYIGMVVLAFSTALITFGLLWAWQQSSVAFASIATCVLIVGFVTFVTFVDAPETASPDGIPSIVKVLMSVPDGIPSIVKVLMSVVGIVGVALVVFMIAWTVRLNIKQ